MNLAEKKVQLFQEVVNADEELTNKLIQFIGQCKSASQFSEEDLAEFNRRREAYLQNPEDVYTVEEVLAHIRKRYER